MSTLDRARATQIKNIEAKTGKSLSELRKLIEMSGLSKHSEIRDMLRKELDLGYGDANSLVHYAKESDGQSAAEASGATLGQVESEIYSGKKEELRPVHDKVMQRIQALGEFEIVPKKKYLSLRRKKQFAMVGPASKGRVEVGLNMKDVKGTARLEVLPPGGMCQYKVYLSQLSEVDEELLGWVKIAYDRAG
jgi:hypothetical protein